jgi:hypothetical protein
MFDTQYYRTGNKKALRTTSSKRRAPLTHCIIGDLVSILASTPMSVQSFSIRRDFLLRCATAVVRFQEQSNPRSLPFSPLPLSSVLIKCGPWHTEFSYPCRPICGDSSTNPAPRTSAFFPLGDHPKIFTTARALAHRRLP